MAEEQNVHQNANKNGKNRTLAAEDNRPQRRGVRGAYGVQMRSVS